MSSQRETVHTGIKEGQITYIEVAPANDKNIQSCSDGRVWSGQSHLAYCVVEPQRVRQLQDGDVVIECRGNVLLEADDVPHPHRLPACRPIIGSGADQVPTRIHLPAKVGTHIPSSPVGAALKLPFLKRYNILPNEE